MVRDLERDTEIEKGEPTDLEKAIHLVDTTSHNISIKIRNMELITELIYKTIYEPWSTSQGVRMLRLQVEIARGAFMDVVRSMIDLRSKLKTMYPLYEFKELDDIVKLREFDIESALNEFDKSLDKTTEWEYQRQVEDVWR